MFCYGISANILHLKFSFTEFESFLIKHKTLQGYLMKETNELTIPAILFENVTKSLTRTTFYI